MPLSNCFPCLHLQRDEIVSKLDCSNAVLTDVFPEVWQHERTLEELCLTSTRLNNLPPQLFYCQNLRVLMVNNNSLESIPNAIGSLRQLCNLNLSRNYLSSNNLQRLPDAITCLITLQELLLNETYLEFLPANFGRLINLKVLELRLNNLLTLPKSMARLCNLQRIDIGGNEFTELPDVIGELKQLRELWIDFNQMRRISPNIAKLRELQHFEANGNLISSLPNEISHWRNIEVLSVCTNSLESLPFSMGMMKSLVTFKCESNDLRELPDSISNLENLEELVLSHNRLLRLPPTIGRLRKLRFLFVDDNELHALPEEICSCSNLSVLSVSRNKITELPQNIGHLTKLRVLNLVNNCIVTLPVSILSLVNLTSLWISDNQSQPLVPLQYLDANKKTQLTCFMLPQVGLRSSQLHQQERESNEVLLLDRQNGLVSRQIEPSRHLNATTSSAESNAICTSSPSRRICFAEEATILTAAVPTQSNLISDRRAGNENSRGAVATSGALYASTAAAEEPAGVRLMRSPTPYPKELRLMAKYVRNSQKQSQSPETETETEISNVQDVGAAARLLLHDNSCDIASELANSGELNDTNAPQPPTNVLYLTSACPQPPNHNDYYYGINHQQQPHQQQHQQHILNAMPQAIDYLQRRFQQSSPTEVLHDSISNYAAPKTLSPLQEQDIMQNYYVVGNSAIKPSLEPPPYHIARVFTKKSPEDLTNYETMHNQHQQKYLQDIGGDQENNETSTFSAMSRFNDAAAAGIEIIRPGIVYQSTNATAHLNLADSPERLQSNISDQSSALFTHMPEQNTSNSYGSRSVPDEAQNLELMQQSHQHLNRSLSQLSNLSGNSSISNSRSQINNASGKRKPWLFGAHKNPTVKQITIEWENHVGFDVAELPNKEGIFISSTVPNTNAARSLFLNDKILEIDGYDFTNINLKDARQIISNAGAVISLLLSRK